MIPKKMPFGKHKGRELHELPLGYVEWLRNNVVLSPLLAVRLSAEFGGRFQTEDQQHHPEQNNAVLVIDTKQLRRRLAAKYHPDRGGDLRLMAVVNEIFDAIEAELIA